MTFWYIFQMGKAFISSHQLILQWSKGSFIFNLEKSRKDIKGTNFWRFNKVFNKYQIYDIKVLACQNKIKLSVATHQIKRQESHLHPPQKLLRNTLGQHRRSTGWKEWAKKSEMVRVDELSKLTNGVVFGLEKRITNPPMSQTQAKLWEVSKALAPLDCLSMQADIKVFYKKVTYKKNMYSKKTKDWYNKFFHQHQKRSHKVWLQTCPQKTINRYQSFNFLLSGVSCFEMLSLQTSKWPQTKTSTM